MKTEFKLIFDGEPDIEIEKFRLSLPSNFLVTEKHDGIYVELESDSKEDERCQVLIDRELDRHFFLTHVKMQATMLRKWVMSSFVQSYSLPGSLPDDIQPQNWENPNLPLQLRLWSIASDHNDTLTKLLLLFQIIELSSPKTRDQESYPKYEDSISPPHPRSECKFIRHLITHAGNVETSQLKHYCAYLEIPETMLDVTKRNYYEKIVSKLPLLLQEAKKVIAASLTESYRMV
jgi:hypothetical protein